MSIIIAIVLISVLILFILFFIITKNNGSSKISFDLPSKQFHYIKKDCDLNYVFSMDTEQCINVCKGPDSYISQNGICVNVLAIDKTTIENNCDINKGVLAYLIGDPEFGTANLICLSIDPGIASDDINQPNQMCMNGSININYSLGYPRMDQCTCPDGMTKITIPETKVKREHIHCVSSSYKSMIKWANLEYIPKV